MTNRNNVDVTFGVDFDQSLDKSYLARMIIDAFDHEGGFEDLAARYKVTTSLGLRFADQAVKNHVLENSGVNALKAGDGLDHFEMDDVDDRASAYIMSGTLKSCLETAAEALQSMNVGVTFAESFKKATEGRYIHPEIQAFYLWMDRKLNGKIQPSP